jgi:alkanesulfonate monooxygenase SsuD/methylene tetrahydromethanopterin reductase-like flavin-dependent oxidoreductase (luciferase family)
MVISQLVADCAESGGPDEAVIVGDEDSVAAQVRALFEAGATDVWAAPFPVGDDAAASRARTRALLASLAQQAGPQPEVV